MKKIIIYLLILSFGVGLLILILDNEKHVDKSQSNSVEKIQPIVTDDFVIKTTQKLDTSAKYKSTNTTSVEKSNHPINESKEIVDCVNVAQQKIETKVNDRNQVEEESDELIIQEKMVSSRYIAVQKSANDSIDKSELLSLNGQSFSNQIIVEFWQSPLNLTGYELSRNKLKLFGFNPNESISLQKGEESDLLLLNTESMSLKIRKSKQFKSLQIK
ncbi:hypothetical protein CW751_11625 [Brumimicrobium salinarum]|uniref:Uncharacterized protein n=1 Tax=Brumimicrobium salinarum TaxID=2058658 RepID=A0A2I0R0S9_9FLAO|nr:hypothetical protein [Brumimicrobium salinarum]PKR80145.1 hypothetical protein CW751_11625 [Brumimicrobium salinarum]